MTVHIILCVAITLLIVSTTCEGLRGDSRAVCIRTVSRNESRYVPYLETYKQKVYGISFRIRTRTNYKKEYHVMHTREAVCCKGYQNSAGICEPFCSEPCTNGECVKPNFCECNRGYMLDFFGQKCEPVCAIPCISGHCTAPETCTCDDGYKLGTDKYTCEPMCSSRCTNGYCAEPNICGCNPGYERNNANECSPVCERPCVNGKCVAPDICTCDDGFQPSYDDVFTCDPECSNPCIFGSCTTPGICTCNQGYELSPGSNFTCVPFCNETCFFGSCIAPDICSCNDGYALTMESKYICKPLCEIECDFGYCIKPNVCQCYDGYVRVSGATPNVSRCEPQCEDACINGICTAPNICTCNDGFRYNSTTKKCDPICTEPCINGFCNAPETCECLEGYAISLANLHMCEAVCEDCTNGYCKAPGLCICDGGFVRDEVYNKSCVPACKPECINGACSAMGCSCDFGWGGISCGESLFCFVSKPLQEVFLEAESYTKSKNEEFNDTQNPRMELDRPACDPQCLFAVNNTTIKIKKTSRNEIQYFLPMGSPCNIASARSMISKTYVSLIGAIVGSILCATILYSVYLIRINKNRKTEINSGSRECVYREEVENDENSTNSFFNNIQPL